jgi:hypothetical protein
VCLRARRNLHRTSHCKNIDTNFDEIFLCSPSTLVSEEISILFYLYLVQLHITIKSADKTHHTYHNPCQIVKTRMSYSDRLTADKSLFGLQSDSGVTEYSHNARETSKLYLKSVLLANLLNNSFPSTPTLPSFHHIDKHRANLPLRAVTLYSAVGGRFKYVPYVEITYVNRIRRS